MYLRLHLATNHSTTLIHLLYNNNTNYKYIYIPQGIFQTPTPQATERFSQPVIGGNVCVGGWVNRTQDCVYEFDLPTHVSILLYQ